MGVGERPDGGGAGAILGLPRLVWGIAFALGALHMLPYGLALLNTPEGWEFSGNLVPFSPDAMQYRAWFQHTADTGVFCDNRFTPEPNPPHLPLPYFWAIGAIGRLIGVRAEFVDAWAGGLFAFALTLLVFTVVRRFWDHERGTWPVFWFALLGGGLGGYLSICMNIGVLQRIEPLQRWLVAPLADVHMFDRYRGVYPHQALFDTFSGLQWTLGLATVLVLHAAISSGRRAHVVACAAMGTLTTFVHLYTGITVATAACGVAAVCALRREHRARALVAVGALGTAVAASLAFLAWKYAQGGLPRPEWEAIVVRLPVLLAGYPVAWGLIAWGLWRYVRGASFDRCFLLGWAVGCVLLLLSGPLYPYPDRGSITAQVPLVLIAGGIWYDRVGRLGWLPVLLAAVLVMSSPVVRTYLVIRSARFFSYGPGTFLSPEHRDVVRLVKERSRRDDLLLAGQGDEFWLAPVFRGRHYSAHFFLTPDYARRNERVEQFLEGDALQRRELLETLGAGYVFIRTGNRPTEFPDGMPIRLIWEGEIGALHHFDSRVPTTERGGVDEPNDR